ncbi:hypothetical protein QQS21_012767 [Conoideocrella luteorostrata]|uniref:Uncharacterized protein n=1 Tax=Conoideocrella luteorostrata TaxID=1105319 RepID=A0AAJ0CAK0_9HYPO|nr:hypothetical protein QQS21_012767 [Conoideocrella luteorostrata]
MWIVTKKAQWSSSGGDVSTMMHEDDNGVVVFMCGIYVTKRMWSDSLRTQSRREKQQLLRAREQEEPFTIRTTDPDGSEVELEVDTKHWTLL